MPAIIAWTISSSIVLIAFSVWGLLMFYAYRSTLETDARRRFAVASAASLLGWLVLAFVLGSAGVFQATPSRVFPALGLGIVLLILAGAWLLYRSSALNAVIAAIPLPWLVLVPLYAVPLSILLHLAALKRLKAVLEEGSNKGLKCGGQPLRWASHPVDP